MIRRRCLALLCAGLLGSGACLSDAVPAGRDGSSDDASAADAPSSDALLFDAAPTPDSLLADAGPPTAVLAMAVGIEHTCVVLDNGAVRCWGEGEYGRLGYADAYGLDEYENPNDIGDDETPADAGDVDLGGFAVGIAAGEHHTCARLSTGKVRCWGSGFDGRLGYGPWDDLGDDETPAEVGDVPGVENAVQIVAGGDHTCVLIQGGTVRCWGAAADGQLGYGNTTGVSNAMVAEDVNVGGTVEELAAGRRHTCARLTGGDVRCWGSSEFGQLGYGDQLTIGDDTDETPNTVDPVSLGAAALRIAAGRDHTCAVLVGGAVRCWGRGEVGQLGHEDVYHVGDTEVPTEISVVNVGKPVGEIAAGTSHTCAVTDESKVRCWGYGGDGALGYDNGNWIGDTEPPADAGDVVVGETVRDIDAGLAFTCALLTTNRVRCWGGGFGGRLGYGNTETIGGSPTNLPYTAGDVPIF